MLSPTQVRRLAAIASATALVGMGALGGCASKDKPAENSPSSSTTPASPSPTEKILTPGPHSDSGSRSTLGPGAKVPAPQTALPGNVGSGG